MRGVLPGKFEPAGEFGRGGGVVGIEPGVAQKMGGGFEKREGVGSEAGARGGLRGGVEGFLPEFECVEEEGARRFAGEGFFRVERIEQGVERRAVGGAAQGAALLAQPGEDTVERRGSLGTARFPVLRKAGGIGEGAREMLLVKFIPVAQQCRGGDAGMRGAKDFRDAEQAHGFGGGVGAQQTGEGGEQPGDFMRGERLAVGIEDSRAGARGGIEERRGD